MPVIQVEATANQLFQAVAQLPPDEFASFVDRVLMLRAERVAPHTGRDEAALLLRINQGVPAPVRCRYDELVGKRREETLSTDEHRELLELTDQFEQLEADRVVALTELARLRQTTVPDLMRSLGIHPPAHACA
jgi:hypothetical protein